LASVKAGGGDTVSDLGKGAGSLISEKRRGRVSARKRLSRPDFVAREKGKPPPLEPDRAGASGEGRIKERKG